MADGKWIDDLKSSMSMSMAARRVFEVRLGIVEERLPLAIHHAEEDLEHVHQLRVGTRRAGAALRIFAECLPARQQKALGKALKKIRRAAGAARDWDVFLGMIAERMGRASREQKPAFDLLLGYGQAQRAVGHGELVLLAATIEVDFATIRNDTLTALAAVSATLRQRAAPLLTSLLADLDTAAAADLQDYARLHEVRIAGKHLRYAMEVFANCFEAEFREKIYPAVEEMQEILGRANDSFVATQRLHEIEARLEMTQLRQLPRFRPGLDSLLRSHQRRLAEQRRLFLQWWTTWKDSGMERRLEKILRG